ncbi:MAG TPA: FAD-dependent oxidoreductase, partial [Acidimicrobiales bacterium]|nr:FAD-dependent oxidoreductase [Acidimicrobiales bacterium]
MPTIFAVAPDPDLRRALDDVLCRRYGSDYAVSVAGDAAGALSRLEASRASGEQVALLLAPFHLPGHEHGGIGFLVRAHELHPGARRIVVVDVGDVEAGGALRRALTLNQVDSYFGQPWASPEEEVHPVVGETLRWWARDHQPRYEKVQIVDAAEGPRGRELRSWLERNNVTTALLAADDPAGRALLDAHALSAERLPVAVLYDGRVLVRPDDDELAEALGAQTHARRARYDVAVVGAGPAGLAAALYAGAEGLHVVLIEQDAVGGQAGTSAKIRNYLGFPWAIGGLELAERASRQAEQLGAEFVVTRAAIGLRAEGEERILTLSNGEEVRAATVVLAGGVTYRRLGVPSVDALIGAGVFYGAAVSEVQSMDGL